MNVIHRNKKYFDYNEEQKEYNIFLKSIETNNTNIQIKKDLCRTFTDITEQNDKNMKAKKILFAALMALMAVGNAPACTNMIVGKKASVDGSTIVSYSADSYGMFIGLYHFPAGKHAAGEMRQVYDWDSQRYLGEIPEARQFASSVAEYVPQLSTRTMRSS